MQICTLLPLVCEKEQVWLSNVPMFFWLVTLHPPSITILEVPLSEALTIVLSGWWYETAGVLGSFLLYNSVSKRQRAPERDHSCSNLL